MSSTSVILNARLFAMYANKIRRWETKRSEESDSASEEKHSHAIQCARVNMLIIYIATNIENASIYKLSRNQAPKHSKFRPTDIWEEPVDFFIVWYERRL